MGLADTVQQILRDKDIEKASDLFSIDIATLKRLNAQRLLNATYIRNLLIRADYERLTSGLHWLEHQDKNYRFPEVIRALAREYNLNKNSIQEILHGRNESLVFCNRCGRRMSKREYNRTKGMCSNCFADTLEL